MANLISCPTWNMQISEIARSCPHCGQSNPGELSGARNTIAQLGSKTLQSIKSDEDFDKAMYNFYKVFFRFILGFILLIAFISTIIVFLQD